MQLSKILGTTSKLLTHKSDIPQGSNLGPHLFNIFIDDLFHSVKYSNIFGFADYVEIFKTISNFNNPTKLQEDLNYFYAWCKTNEINLNFNKCLSLIFSNNRNSYNSS